MDSDLLRAKGFAPQGAEVASVEGLALRIGRRAALVAEPSARVYGILMSLTLDEFDRLYSDPSVQAYRPTAVLAHLEAGGVVAALCYNLPDPPSPAERDPDYLTKLQAVARKVGLPYAYVESLTA